MIAILLLVLGCLSTGAVRSIMETAHQGTATAQAAGEDAPVASTTSSATRRRVVALRRRIRVWARRVLDTGPFDRHIPSVLPIQPRLRPPALTGSTVLRL